MEAVFADKGAYAELASLLEEEAKNSHSAEERSALWRRVGDGKASSLADPGGAAQAYLGMWESPEQRKDAEHLLQTLHHHHSTDERVFGAYAEALRRNLPELDAAERLVALSQAKEQALDPIADVAARTELLWEIATVLAVSNRGS